jgi:tetratricopeptide (TPR) repeat protein
MGRNKNNKNNVSTPSRPDVSRALIDAARRHQAGEVQAAESAYHQILALDPNQPDALHLLGLIRSQQSRPAEAEQLIRSAIARQPNSPDYHNSLGAVLATLGHTDQAIASYRAAIHHKPEYTQAHYNLAAALQGRGAMDEAVTHYEHVLAVHPEDLQTRNNLGCVLQSLGRCDEARAQFEDTIRRDPDHAMARDNLARLTSNATDGAEDDGPLYRPLIISAPTERNGVTLLQRLLNSTRQIIVYGEDTYFFKSMPEMIRTRQSLHDTGGPAAAGVLKQFCEETTEFWSSNLWPDTRLYAETMRDCFNRVAQVYAATAKHYGFKRWGIKHPMTTAVELTNLLGLLDRSPTLFIHRHPIAVARSAKARRFAVGPEQIKNLGQRWNDNMCATLDVEWPHMLVIPHHALTSEPDSWIDRIEAFAGLQGIDRSTLQRRFNTFTGEPANGHSPTQYIEPADLTAEETAAILGTTAEARARVGYDEVPNEVVASASCG